MDALLSAGIDFILAVQAHATPASDRFFSAFTQLGASGYLLLVPLVLWCYDARLGVRIALAMAATLFINTVLKDWIGLERPYLADDRIVSAGERGYSMPSGHAQLVVVYWSLVAHRVGRVWFWCVAVVWMFLMGFSRVYLGVHYPTDVVVGWGLGALTAWAFITWTEAIDGFLRDTPLRPAVGAFFLIALSMILFDATLVHDHTHLITGVAGFTLGSGLGGLWMTRARIFTGRGDRWQLALRLVLGIAMLIALTGGMRRVGVPDGDVGTTIVVAIDLAIVGLFMTGGAPWLFEKIWLVRRPDDLGEIPEPKLG